MHEEKSTDVFQVIGNFGRWQFYVCFFCVSINVFSGFYTLVGPFYAPRFKAGSRNVTTEFEDPCVHHKYNQSLNWNFDRPDVTIITEWNLVCERAWLTSLTQSVYLVGMMFSGPLIGQLSDRYGRLPITLVTIFFEVVVNIISAISNSIMLFTVSRFLLAIVSYGRNLTTFLLAIETVGQNYRGVVAVLFQLGYALGHILLPIIAYHVTNFRTLLLVTSLPEILWLLLVWKVPESIDWQLARGRYEDARKTITTAVKINRISESDVDGFLQKRKDLNINDKSEKIDKSTESNIWKLDGVRSTTLVLFYLWFVNSFAYYGITLNIGSLANDVYTSFVIAGLLEIPAYILSAIAIHYMKPRNLTLVTLFTVGVAYLALVLPNHKNRAIITALALIGKLSITACYSVLMYYTGELYPTTVRQAAIGYCSFVGRLGSVMAPFLKELGQLSSKHIPLLLLSSLCLSGSGLLLCIPSNDTIRVKTLEKKNGCIKAVEC